MKSINKEERIGAIDRDPGESHWRINTYREAIKESIEVLEDTRKSFKSKRLGELRKKLTQVLTASNFK